MKYSGTKKIETERLILRKFRKADAAVMYNNWASDDEVTKYLTWDSHENIEHTKFWVNKWLDSYHDKTFFNWAIVFKENNEPIGSIAAINVDKEKGLCEAGYCMSKKYWHRGIMAEALKAMLDYLLNDNPFVEIQAKHNLENPNSGRVMEKAGMEFLKYDEDYIESKKQHIKIAVYSIKKKY